MNIFIAFANQDRDVRDKLLRQMNLVKDRQGWHIWSSKEIKAGERWDDEIKQRLMDSEVVVLLLSTDFFNSKYIIETELPKVVEKHRLGNCQIIPVIARVCHWKETAFGEYAELGDIQALPVGEKPITSKIHWGDEDQPYFEVVEGMKEAIRAFQGKKKESVEAAQRECEAQIRHQQEQAQRDENERLAQLRQAQEQEARRAAQAAWQQAADAHTLPAYEAYLLAHPRGEYAREARYRIKELKRQQAAPLPWGRYALLGGGALAVVLVFWLAFGSGRNEAVKKQKHDIQMAVTARLDTLKVALQDTCSTQVEREAKKRFEEKLTGPMIQIEEGTFTMGSPTAERGRYFDECQHPVVVSTFLMGKYEVTQAQWKAVMGKNPSIHKNCDNCPVENVSWNDVQAFLKKLNSLTGKAYRLPSESEWEYAARGGKKSKGFVYSGSNMLDSVAWHKDNSGSKTRSVGGKSPNELGLYDMSGNVWEWCQDSWKPYPNCKADPVGSRNRVSRGGSAVNSDSDCRAAYRYYDEMDRRYRYLGFRLAHDALALPDINW